MKPTFLYRLAAVLATRKRQMWVKMVALAVAILPKGVIAYSKAKMSISNA